VGDGHARVQCIAFSTEDSCSHPGSNNHSQTIPRKTAVSSSIQEEFNIKEDMKSEKKTFSPILVTTFSLFFGTEIVVFEGTLK
jgi:hypothetical protein